PQMAIQELLQRLSASVRDRLIKIPEHSLVGVKKQSGYIPQNIIHQSQALVLRYLSAPASQWEEELTQVADEEIAGIAREFSKVAEEAYEVIRPIPGANSREQALQKREEGFPAVARVVRLMQEGFPALEEGFPGVPETEAYGAEDFETVPGYRIIRILYRGFQ